MRIILKRSLTIAFILTSLYSLSSVSANAPKPETVPSPAPSKLKIKSDEATYDRKNKKALAKGHVKITQDNVTIYTSEALYDDNIKVTQIDDFARLIHLDKENKRKTDISSNKMTMFHQIKKVHMEDKVRFDREEENKALSEPKTKKTTKAPKTEREKIEEAVRKERTVIMSDSVDYFTRSGDATFTGKGTVLQRNKKALGDVIKVKNDDNKETDTITLEGNAMVSQIKGDWLVREGIIKIDGEKEKERFVKEKLDMFANTIFIEQKKSKITGIGKVRIVQDVANKKREAIGDHAVYDDMTKAMVLTGNVEIKRDTGDWLKAQKAVFHTDSENFEAYADVPIEDIPIPNLSSVPNPPNIPKKQVETEFTIPDEDKPEPKESIKPYSPDLNLEEGKNNKNEKKKVVPTPNNSPKNSSVPNLPQGTPTTQSIPTPSLIPSNKPSITPSPNNAKKGN
ncbi:MAG: LptA/OstA family protein [Candidatus Sericytochromatia bacterium]